MFATSTHKRHWLFASRDVLAALRLEANQSHCREMREIMTSLENAEEVEFLSPEEEASVCSIVQETAQKFCLDFRPPMPPTVVAVALTYFKRFYLRNSVMKHVAKSVMMGCMYLACKVEEFNVSIDEFVRNFTSGSHSDNVETVLSYELELMWHLNYQFTVHTPYRPLEGLMIDIKTRYPDIRDPERLRAGCEQFLWKSLLSDACLLFPPSQIALAALKASSSALGISLDGYFNLLTKNQDVSEFAFVQRINNITSTVESSVCVSRANADAIMQKLRNCISLTASAQQMT